MDLTDDAFDEELNSLNKQIYLKKKKKILFEDVADENNTIAVVANNLFNVVKIDY